MNIDIVVDAQNDFLRPDGKLYVPGAEAIIAPLQNYLANLGDDCWGVLFTQDTHLLGVYEQSEEAKEFPIHCVKDTEGWRLAVDPSVVRRPVYTLEKGVFDMWKEPAMVVSQHASVSRGDFFIDLVVKNVRKVRVTGVAADYCVRWAIDGLVARGFEVEVIKDLTMGIQRSIDQVVQDEFPKLVTITSLEHA